MRLDLKTHTGDTYLVREVVSLGKYTFSFRGAIPFVTYNNLPLFQLTYRSVAVVEIRPPILEEELPEKAQALLKHLAEGGQNERT